MGEDFDVVRIVKQLREIRIVLQAKGFMTNDNRIKAAHSGENVIVISDEEEENSSYLDDQELKSNFGAFANNIT